MVAYDIVAFIQLLLIITAVTVAQPDGWKMTDRFYGFRYELIGKGTDPTILERIQQHADTIGCFGWVQLSKFNKSVVGEARCSKAKGKPFQDWLESLAVPNSESNNFRTLVYADTKIRLHFSHFKILDTDRDTCFLDIPHQCLEFSSGGKSATVKEEL